MNYYNEFDPKAAAWIRELIAQNLIPAGHVDERSIKEVSPDDLDGYTQCHFFAGIAGWSLALSLASWPATRPVWTGSCPCQPFSVAGKGKGTADERHLWPDFRRLIAECKPSKVFGEQVASKAGRGWLAGVFADLEDVGYAVAGADLCAAGVGAPHIRQRIYWVAHRYFQGSQGWECGELHERADELITGEGGASGGMGYTDGSNGEQLRGHPSEDQKQPIQREQNPWSAFEALQCGDGKARRIEPGTFPLAHGVSGRVGLLRGYGNAIVPQVAAEFVSAYLDTE